MSAGAKRFGTAYESVFREYLLDSSESNLRAAYELGRDAVSKELGMLDLAMIHHDVLVAMLLQSSADDDVAHVARRAGEFFVESISAFEMVQRGFREARDAALLERRHATMLRQLSNLLADASLAVDDSGSVQEMLQLVVEQARELVNADSCRATVLVSGRAGRIEAVSSSGTDARPIASSKSAQFPAIYALGDRAVPSEVERAGPPTCSSLAAPLTALDGRDLGCIRIFGSKGDFTELDEAVLVHIAQMASAAMERAWLYSQRRFS